MHLLARLQRTGSIVRSPYELLHHFACQLLPEYEKREAIMPPDQILYQTVSQVIGAGLKMHMSL